MSIQGSSLLTKDPRYSGFDTSNSLVGSGNIDKAAIFNTEGTSVWASSQGFEVCQSCVGNGGCANTVQGSGRDCLVGLAHSIGMD